MRNHYVRLSGLNKFYGCFIWFLLVSILLVGGFLFSANLSADLPSIIRTCAVILAIIISIIFARRLVHSIRLSLTLWYVAILAVILFLFSFIIYATQIGILKAQLRTSLSIESARISTAYDIQTGRINSSIPLELTNDNEIALFITPDGAIMHVLSIPIKGPQNNTFYQPLAAQVIEDIQRGSASPFFNYSITFPHQVSAQVSSDLYYFTYLPIRAQDHIVALVVVGQEDYTGGSLRGLAVALLIVGPMLLILSTFGGFWLADRAMRPVQTITRVAQHLSETDLHQRLNLKRSDELGELGATFDHMLARLESAFERQRQFTADASHELRTPLAIVQLEATRTLEQASTHEECLQALTLIQYTSISMSRLVNDLLLLARSDNGYILLKKERVDLSDIIVDVVDRLVPLAHQQDIRLALGQLPAMPFVGDHFYLTQMLTNLIENAIKYTTHVGTSVSIEARFLQVQKQKWNSICISDDGPGIPAEHIPHIFDRFYRVDSSRTHHFDEPGIHPIADKNKNMPSGSGLGLSIAQWVAQAHGGRIVVQSQEGVGSVFEILLPCQNARS